MSETEDLKIKHADVYNNPAVKKIAYWRQTNTEQPLNSIQYSEKAKKNLPKMLRLFNKNFQE